MRSLPDISTLDWQWKSKPRPFDLEVIALSTRPRVPGANDGSFLSENHMRLTRFYTHDHKESELFFSVNRN